MSEQVPTKERFSIGEVAICIGHLSGIHYDCTIVALPIGQDSLFTDKGNLFKRHAGQYLIECSDGRWTCFPEQLRKKRPPREDLKIVGWGECPWLPQRETA